MGRGDQPFALAAQRFAQSEHPHRHQQPRQAAGEIGGLPAFQAERREAGIRIRAGPAIDDPAAQEDADAGADIDAA